MAIPDTNQGINRRRSQRRKPRTSVKLQCRKGAIGLGRNLTKVTLDISECGARLTVLDELAINAEVELQIESYGVKPIKRIATVKWQFKLEDGTFCVGIEFAKRIDYRDWQNLASPN